jgi:phospholipid transport system transporter-binding protein
MVVYGNLTMETVPAIFEDGLQQLASDDMRVDFSHVESVDSAAVSLLMGWARAANRYRHSLYVAGLPQDLQSLSRLYGVIDLLPKQSAAPVGNIHPS